MKPWFSSLLFWLIWIASGTLMIGGITGSVLAYNYPTETILEALVKLVIFVLSFLVGLFGVFAFLLSALSLSVLKTASNTTEMVNILQRIENADREVDGGKKVH